jgi:two-component system, OmpR family, sensor histidine kinase SenX3
MFWRREKEVAVESGWEIPGSLLELLAILDAEYLILAPGEQVLSSSAGTGALAMIRDGRLVSTPLLNLVRAVRRSNVYQEATVELPRGPIGQGTHDLLVRVSPVGSRRVNRRADLRR